MHYDFPEFEIKGKDIALGVIIVLVLFGVCFYAEYCIGWERCQDVHGDGAGTQPISTELGNAGTAITDAKDGIHQAQGTAGEISNTIKDAAGTADYIGTTADNSTNIIRQSKSIIERIRSRGETQKAQN